MSGSTSLAAEVPLSVAAAAAELGLTPATLRTWDRRYGLSPSARTIGGHRRYGSDDLLRLRLVARMVEDGLPPAGATQAVASWTVEECRQQLDRDAVVVRDTGEGDSEPRSGGGRSIAMPEASPAQRGLARAAMALDAQAVRDIMSTAIAEHGAVNAWNQLAAPTLIAIGDRWERTRENVEVEHIASLGIQQALSVADPGRATGRPVLLCCAPDDQHGLALLALRAALIERDVPTVLLGSRVPAEALVAAVVRLRPRAVVVWASFGDCGDASVFESLPTHRPPIRLFAAGPGWRDVRPTGTRPLTSLDEAIAELAPST